MNEMKLKPARVQEIPGALPFSLKCVACLEPADVLFEGTSYCKKDIQEKLRTGAI